ncbi:MAG TPA: aspartate--tRNA(Asn) ligase [bacterium]|nr:aspartate--tRNA(Asn) ligase [bacterium]HPT29915.1 aspartate--tRNA(Asn) ligase [bacterium]
MMSINQAKSQGQGEVVLSGFVYNKRAHKGVVFVDLRDLSGVMQVVMAADHEAVYNQAETLTLESYITVTGTLQAKPAKKGEEDKKDFELLATELKIESLALEQLSIPVLNKIDNEADIDLRLDWRFLDLRQPEKQMIFKVWTELEKGCRRYFDEHNFLQIYTPTLMNTASETGADVFEVKYFDRKAYLAQSPQFYKQMAMAAGLEKVFMVGTVYRAEKSFTNRHVTEFTGWDFEIANISSHEEIMDQEEGMLVAGFQQVKEKLALDITVPTQPFPRLTLAQAKEKLAAKGIKSEASDDFTPEEERGISEIIKAETGHDFVFVTDYPVSARPFYHMVREDNPELTKSFDLLYRGLEITTGAQREHRIEILEKQAQAKGMNLEELSDYLNFFRYGIPSHGGVGIGPARIVMKLLGLSNIKEANYLPRDVKRLRP